MISWFLFGKKEVRKFKRAVQTAFGQIKGDFSNIEQWLNHFRSKSFEIEESLKELKGRLSSVEIELEELKNFNHFFVSRSLNLKKKPVQTPVQKQTAVYAVQTPVQTAVQTAVQTSILKGLTANERLLVWGLLNTKMKISYEDLATMFGKNKSTIRGQLNNIKQKSEGVISEITDQQGKKRFYIKEEIKENLRKLLKKRLSK